MTFKLNYLFWAVFAVAVIAVTFKTADAAESQAALASSPSLAGKLTDERSWRAYKARFVTEQGRVVDTGNDQISHSEGQGYGMLLAVAASDRDAFDRIWGWTRANLMVRGDELSAWRWEPNKRPAVADLNNASDGDLLIAWALAEADEAWKDLSYRISARRIASDLARKLILSRTSHGSLLLPAIAGFSADDRSDGPVVNLSYWVFPALERMPSVAPEFDWAELAENGRKLLRTARFGNAKLPVEWTALGAADARPATGFAPTFAYNAVRIPLYLAWSGTADARDLAPFRTLWTKRAMTGLPIIDVTADRPTGSLGEKGYAAVADLAACAANGARLPSSFSTVDVSENYYPVTLHMLAQIAVQMRYRSCLRG